MRPVLASLVVLLLAPAAATATPPGTNGLIAFSSLSRGEEGVWTVAPDGSVPRRAVPIASVADGFARFTADGSQLAFVRDGALRTSAADGADERPVPTGAGGVSDPAPSPTDGRIAFARGGDLWIRGGDGVERQLTDGSANDVSPAWSPDGTQLAFARSGGAEQGPSVAIYVVSAAGGTARIITSEGWAFAPSWSPDGTRIAYSTGAGSQYDIVTVSPQGLDKASLTRRDPSRSVQNGNPVWSPDGRSIVFASNRSGDPDLWIMDADGTNQRALLAAPGVQFPTDWQRLPGPAPAPAPQPPPVVPVAPGVEPEDPRAGGTRVASFGGVTVWSRLDRDDAGRPAYRLVVDRGGVATAAPLRTRPVPFDADVGPGPDGRPLVVFSGCGTEPRLSRTTLGAPRWSTAQGCGLSALDPATGAVRALRRPVGGSLVLPAVSGRELVAFSPSATRPRLLRYRFDGTTLTRGREVVVLRGQDPTTVDLRRGRVVLAATRFGGKAASVVSATTHVQVLSRVRARDHDRTVGYAGPTFRPDGGVAFLRRRLQANGATVDAFGVRGLSPRVDRPSYSIAFSGARIWLAGAREVDARGCANPRAACLVARG